MKFVNSPYFQKIYRFPHISAKLRFFGLIYVFCFPYFDRDAFYSYWTPLDTVSELTRRSATGNCEWRTCTRSLRGGYRQGRPVRALGDT